VCMCMCAGVCVCVVFVLCVWVGRCVFLFSGLGEEDGLGSGCNDLIIEYSVFRVEVNQIDSNWVRTYMW